MVCNKAKYSINKGIKRITYFYNNGYTVVHEGGSRSWRNNNPGNLKGAVNRRIGVDNDGFDIYADLETGEKARRRMFEPGGKYYSYASIRQVMTGLNDKNGKFIAGSAYAPSNDKNYPNQYADHIRKWTGIDVDNKKICNLTREERNLLEDAMKRNEGWEIGVISEYDQNDNIIDNYVPGSYRPEDEYYVFTIFP